MMRWTRLAIAVLIAGCAKGEKSQSAADATTADTAMRTEAPVDTSSHAVRSDTGAAKKSAPAVAGKAKASEVDTTAARKQVATTGAAANSNGVTGAEAMTGVRPTAPSQPLSGDQIKRLQAALNKVGCHAGTPDGAEGPGTQRAIACGLKKYNLASDDLNGLYRKLGLNF